METGRISDDVQHAGRAYAENLAHGVERVQEKVEERVRREADRARNALSSLSAELGGLVRESPILALGGGVRPRLHDRPRGPRLTMKRQGKGRASEPGAGEVLAAVGDAANELGAYVGRMVEEQPAMAVVGALAAGFVAGGGLLSPLGMRLAGTTVRAAFGNLTTLVALELVRRGLDGGGDNGRARGESAGAE